MPISKAQLRWAHTPTGEKALGSSRVKQWDEEAKGVDLPERSAGEQARIAAICRACVNYGPATTEPNMGFEVCLCGCSGVKRENRPPLGAVWKMAGGRCLDDKVKAW